MVMLDWLWVAAAVSLGAVVGSFLNVVIYRLPRNLSVAEPRRSFCPQCDRSIAAFDNIPIASFLWLGGQCRHCHGRISVRYPVVEALCALLFVFIVDTFWIGEVRDNVATLADWPIVAAHAFLVAGLLAISGMDIEEYMVDLRITWLIMSVGCVAHTVWCTSHTTATWQPWPATGAAALAATIGLGLSRLLWPPADAPPEDAEATEPTPASRPANDRTESGRSVVVWVLLGVLLSVLGLMAMDASLAGSFAGGDSSFPWRAALVIGACFAGVVGASAVIRDSDAEIVGAIDEERPIARRVVLGELRYLLPSIVLGSLTVWLLGYPSIRQAWMTAWTWTPIGDHEPLRGLTTALAGMIIAGGVGWGVRIGFTLLLGREAFGLGDVHIMAAAGAVTGWFVVTMGFFLGAVLAILGVICLLAVKRSRAIPFGPWLSMGIIVAIAAYEPLYRWLETGLEGLALAINNGTGP